MSNDQISTLTSTSPTSTDVWVPVTGTDIGNKRAVDTYIQGGNVTASIGGLLGGVSYDYISVSYPDSVTEVYSYKSGGSSGTLVATITVIYTTSTKEYVTSVEKT